MSDSARASKENKNQWTSLNHTVHTFNLSSRAGSRVTRTLTSHCPRWGTAGYAITLRGARLSLEGWTQNRPVDHYFEYSTVRNGTMRVKCVQPPIFVPQQVYSYRKNISNQHRAALRSNESHADDDQKNDTIYPTRSDAQDDEDIFYSREELYSFFPPFTYRREPSQENVTRLSDCVDPLLRTQCPSPPVRPQPKVRRRRG